MNRRLSYLFCLAFIILALTPAKIPAEDFSEQLLRIELENFQAFIQQTLEAATKRVEADSDIEDVDKRARLWRQELVDQDVLGKRVEDIRAELIRQWVLARQVLDYLDTGKGRDLFGDSQYIMIAAMQAVLARVEQIGSSYLDAQAHEKVEKRVEEYARKHAMEPPDKSGFFPLGLDKSVTSAFNFGVDTVKSIGSLPLKPFESIGKGGTGIYEASKTLEEMKNILDTLPQDVRVEIETLFERLEMNATTVTLLLRETRETADALSGSLESGAAFSREVNATLERTTPTLRAAEDVTKSLEKLVREARSLMDQLQGLQKATSGTQKGRPFHVEEYRLAAAAIEGGARETRLMLKEIRTLTQGSDDKKDGPEKGRPFDIREYAETARAIEAGAAEIRRGLMEARDLAGSDGLTTTALQARDVSQGLIDYLALRVAGLFVLAGLLAVVVLLVARRKPEA